MKKLEFKIIEKCFQDASQKPGNDADFYLEENDWNDFGYYVLYHIHATKRLTKTKNICLGYVRIMRKGQTKSDMNLLGKMFGDKPFVELPQDFVSITFEYDLFKWLYFQDMEIRQSLANQLHLIISEKSPYYLLVKDDDCFNKALLRDATMDNYVLHKADQWINQIERRYELRAQKITLKYDNCDDEIPLSFSCLPDIESKDIPNGIIAFIGANGSGKSTALYSFVKAMFLFPEDRDILERKFCIISPNDIGVERLILISYSPFDNFTMPSMQNFAMHDVQEITRDRDGRFVYCGIRDLDIEYRKLQDNGIQKDYKYLQSDRQGIAEPKTQERLAADFAYAFQEIINDESQRRLAFWSGLIEASKVMHPDLAEKMELMMEKHDAKEWAELFKDFSTGYKFFFHSMAYVVAFITEGSLLLFDEPENHIHPPLLSFMMTQYREILRQYNSVMLVSTHSPVIIQELFADNVLKVYRDGDKIKVQKPSIETYGATFGEINSEVFGLTSDVTKYFSAIDALYELWHLNEQENANAMLKSIESHLKRPLSNQVVSYLISKYYGDNPDKN